MAISQRLAKLEATKGTRPDPGTAATFAALVVMLNHLAARKAAGDTTAQPEIESLALACSASFRVVSATTNP